MSELPVDAVEQSPAAATSETVKMDIDAPAPADKVEEKKENGATEDAKNEEKAEEKVEAKSESNGEKKDEKKEDEKPKKNGASDRKYNNNNKYDKQKTFNRYSKARSESKFDPSVLPETDDPSLIRAQVEFYFGDANLPTDKFMWEMTQGTKNIPVPISKIASFKRMQRFQPYSAVVAALKESNSLEVEGEEGLETVKRKVAYDPNFRPGQAAMARSIYAKGFGDEEPTTQFDIEAFFSPYGPINVVRLRRTEEKLFKGSVFVEFAEEDLAKKFLALDPKPKWKGEYDLQITSKLEYTSAKAQDIRDGKLEPNQTRPKPFNGNKESGDFRGRGRGRGHHRGGDRRGDRDPDDWKKRREDDQKSGFKDHRGGRGKGGRGGRGGRDDRGHRNNDRNDRNREREEKEKNGESKKAEPKAEGQSENNEKTETKAEVQSENNEKKRPREEGATDEAPPAKKVDTKSEVTAEAS